jgi:aminomethyltransferase
MSAALARTPLHALHAELGARFVPFAGYEMPVQYTEGIRAEHLWTRANAGLFDVSHMGQVRARGPEIERALERALPVDFAGWPVGLQRYSLLLNGRGGIEDDLMLLRLAGEIGLVVNAACKDKDLVLLRTHCPGIDFRVLDRALIALQGPRAEEALSALNPESAALAFMQAGAFTLADAECFVTRSGYTGEDGFEISAAAGEAEALARRLLAHPAVKPIGLGARDTLRLEAALPLYGQDLDEGTTPREAGLDWAIAKARRAGGAKPGGFPGAERVLREEREEGTRRLFGFVGLGRAPIRHGAHIVDASGRRVGTVTSGTVSPTLGKPVMLGYLKREAWDGVELFALVRGEQLPIEPAALPFVPKRYKRR